ncbi:GNAT family protein [Paucibacter sp. APW11]|uniref:GNAT family protein n=1 Tax=Roseateles aquae TaxID=3077235 RepID=A0ABU3PE53_9BURK|nr:GNAT family protein [Paucibacter sp. APW11]MDT9000866.1 GNAT family protein [Paucibacter sp. APW11]
MSFPILQTNRLLLREIVPADAPALLAIHGDAELMRWFGSDPLPDQAAAEALVARFASWRQLPAPGTRFGLARRERPQHLIGTAGLFGWNPGWRKCTLGYELAREAQGQGLMREALLTLLDWGFAAMSLNRIEAQVHPDNAASLKQVRALGFVEEGRLRQVGFWRGQYQDLLQFGLLKADWDALQLRA